MKKIVIMLMFACGVSYGQVGNVEISEDPIVIGKANNRDVVPALSYTPGEKENLYTLSYYNGKYEGLEIMETFGFYGTDKDLEYFYNAINDRFGKDDNASLDIGGHNIIIMPSGKNYVYLYVSHSNGTESSLYLHKKQFNRLFGKS